MINIIALSLSLLVPLLKQLIDKKVAQNVIDGVQAAVDALLKVQGTPVTYEQIESLRFDPQWGPDAVVANPIQLPSSTAKATKKAVQKVPILDQTTKS